MNRFVVQLIYWVIVFLAFACVDALDQTLIQRVNLVVVESTITDLDEPQLVYLNRSKSDSSTGRFGSLPLSGATVEVVVDSAQVIVFPETDPNHYPGRYQAPDHFRGQVGHSYQLRLILSDGTKYQSSTERMVAVPLIQRVYQTFNPTSLSPGLLNSEAYRAANDVFIDWQDAVRDHNYYRWDWKLFERQTYCKTCMQGWYLIYDLADQTIWERCFSYPTGYGYFVNDYSCRSDCWAILHNYTTDVFDDQYSNGGLISHRRIAQVPYYQLGGCLIEIRQSSLTPQAYRYDKQVEDQTQNTGGVADTPPTALAGNIKNIAIAQERVIGYFRVSAVSATRLWISRQEDTGMPPGLFRALNSRLPSPEDLEYDPETHEVKPKFQLQSKLYNHPPTAPCLDGDDSTPIKPEGWRG